MMLVAPVAKIVALLVAQIAIARALTPPSAPKAKEVYMPSMLATIWQRLLPHLTRFMFWSLTIAEVATAFSASDLCPDALAQPIAGLLNRNHTSLQQIGTLSPAFLAGIFLAITGALFRLYCFRVLGQFFTFELSVRSDHKLVTSGPYSIVRHPSYTGGLCMQLGHVIAIFDRNSWLVASSGLFPHDEVSLTQVLWCLRVLATSVPLMIITTRTNNEDVMLEKAFGKEWRAWAKKVPYKLVPGVY